MAEVVEEWGGRGYGRQHRWRKQRSSKRWARQAWRKLMCEKRSGGFLGG